MGKQAEFAVTRQADSSGRLPGVASSPVSVGRGGKPFLLPLANSELCCGKEPPEG